MLRGNRLRLFTALVVLVVWAGPARAWPGGPLIAELVDYPDVRAVIPADTAATFGRVVGATEDQRAAAAVLVDSARTELARVVNRHLRTVRDDPTLEQMRTSESKVLKEAAGIERQLLEDLLNILQKEQQAAFGAFERAHRRALLARVRPQPMPVDLWEFFASRGFDASADGTIKGLLDRFDRESDEALVRQRRALMAYFGDVRRGADGSEEGRKRSEEIFREYSAASGNMDRVFASVVEPLLNALPSGVRDGLVLEIIAQATFGFDRNLANPDRYPVVREVLALELLPEQRRAVGSIVDAAKAEALSLARVGVVEQARYVLMDADRRSGVPTAPLNIYLERASKLRVRAGGEALAVLTAEQRKAYDASAVVDPSTSSVVGDE